MMVALVVLSGCESPVGQDTSAVTLSDDALGHFCQMNLRDHDGPKAQIHLDGLPGVPLFFGQVRDAIAYMRLPEQSHRVLAVWVNDMGAPSATWSEPGDANWIDAASAIYVVGSRAVGGMGLPETVPFADLDAAQAFVRTHGGQTLSLNDIPSELVLAPVALPGEGDEDDDFEQRKRALSRDHGD